MEKIKILMVDDHKMVTNAIAWLLNEDRRFDVVGEAANAEEAISMATSKIPEIVLVEINMKDGFDIVEAIRKFSPASRLIGLSVYTMIAHAKKFISAGGSGYVTKNSSIEELIQAILEVHQGRKFICSEMQGNLTRQMMEEEVGGGASGITKRELEVIGYIKQGLASKEIAKKMHISVKTIEGHRYNILKKLKLRNVAALVNYINMQGL